MTVAGSKSQRSIGDRFLQSWLGNSYEQISWYKSHAIGIANSGPFIHTRIMHHFAYRAGVLHAENVSLDLENGGHPTDVLLASAAMRLAEIGGRAYQLRPPGSANKLASGID